MERKDIVCHAFPSWRGDYVKSTIQIMKELAVNHNVLYVDYAYSWKDILFNSFKNRYIPVARVLGVRNPIESVNLENGGLLHVLSLPPVIPFNWISSPRFYSIIQKLNLKLLKCRVNRAMRKLGINSPVVINAFNPHFGFESVKVFSPALTVYYCYDNIDAANWASKHGSRLEKEFIENAEALIFTSDELAKGKASGKANTHVINNGVDLTIFDRESVNDDALSEDEKIIIGYVGSVDDRIDYDLISAMATQRPGWNFHFIGRITGNFHMKLASLPNVTFFGPMPYSDLPGIIKGFTVGIIPFVKNEFTRNIYPMKANEYLAMGIPVVATDFADLFDLSRVVKSVDAGKFLQTIENEIANNSIQQVSERKAVARSNSWKAKAKMFTEILDKYAERNQ